MIRLKLTILLLILSTQLFGAADHQAALKRIMYLLSGRMPNNGDLEKHGYSKEVYREKVRELIQAEQFYNSMVRYHERIYGTGLQLEFIDELQNNDIDDRANKFAKISCDRSSEDNRMRCHWTSSEDGESTAECPQSWEEPVSTFWYPSVVAWACPSVIRACGHDLSRCFIQHADEDEAKNSELGTTEVFDSRFSVIKSLSRQSSGISSRIAMENYPYKLILKSGLSAVDGAVIHFYRQNHHFKIDELRIPNEVFDLIKNLSFTDSKYALVNTGETNDSGGILTQYAFLRRYEKHRTRGNEMYERLLCRKFTAELPRVFPQDPGNLRETPGCSGCHALLDPLADFFNIWGEGGELYEGPGDTTNTSFAGKSGTHPLDIANIVANDKAFATCTTMNVWEWLMGRQFYHSEDELRAAFTNYFIDTSYSFRELVYAIATHPAFTEGTRSDGTVTDPLEDPPLGEVPNDVTRPCDTTISYSADISPSISLCTACHNSGSSPRVDLSSESAWTTHGSQAVQFMASGQMPPGQFGPTIIDFKEKVRCWLEQM